LKIIRSIAAFDSSEKTIVTIGTFDGIHIGHKKILKNLISTAKKEGKKSVLLTFFLTLEWCCKKTRLFCCLTP